jgi:hypothetical protein
VIGFEDPEAMLNSRNLVAALRRDLSFVWHVVIAIVFVGFAGLAVLAAVMDLIALRH